MSLKSSPGIPLKPFPYEGFMGLDDSRDYRAMDTGQQQHLNILKNAQADWRGQLVTEQGASKRTGANSIIDHISPLSQDLLAWAERDDAVVKLNSERAIASATTWPLTATPSSVVFGGRSHFMTQGQTMQIFNGITWSANPATSNPKPAFGAVLQNRMAIGGQVGRDTRVDLCRVDNHEKWYDDEDPSSADVLKGAYIDISNVIGNYEVIKGLGSFDSKNLAIFGRDRTIVWQIDPDYTKWLINANANIRTGCVSHNTIQPYLSDLIFCSRHGVHTLRKSDYNGVTIFSLPLSSKVENTYKALVASVDSAEKISGVVDADSNRYHIFFPQPGNLSSKRLTIDFNPNQGQPDKWSYGEFLNARCGAFLAGRLSFGTVGGIWEPSKTPEVYPTATIKTPVIWGGSLTDEKSWHSYVLQASGNGKVEVTITDEDGKHLTTESFNIEGIVDDTIPSIALSRQYERQLEHRTRGLIFTFTVSGSAQVKIVAFAVFARKDK